MASSNTEYQKRRINVYSMMMLLSFVALLIGTILLYMELSRYGDQFLNWWDTSGATPAPAMLSQQWLLSIWR